MTAGKQDIVTKSDASATDTKGGDAADAWSPKKDWNQGYSASLTFHTGTSNGTPIEFDRDLSGSQTILSFGNAHLVPPAVAFVVSDIATESGKKINLELDFGILVGSAADVVATPAAGAFPFTCKKPKVVLLVDKILYSSTCAISAGAIQIVDWAATAGGHISGTVKGKLIKSEALPECGCGDSATFVDLEVTFGFTLPELNSDTAP